MAKKAAAKKAPAKKSATGAKRGPKPGTKAVAAPAPVQAKARYMVTANDLQVLMKRVRGLEKEGATITGSLREKIAYAVEKQHLNKGMFALMRKLDKMEPEALAIWLEDFDHYLEASGLEERANSVQTLPLGADNAAENAGDAEDEGSEPEQQPSTEVSRPRLAAVGGAAA